MIELCTCPNCGGVATLIKDTMTIQKGIVKVSVKADRYKCGVCKQEFSSHEQRVESMGSLVQNTPMLNSAKDMRAKVQPRKR